MVKKVKNSKGFTIVETLIVLSVTGMLFVSTSLLIQGQIERYRYRDAMYRTQQILQTIINDTQNGYFPKLKNNTPTVNGDLLGSKCNFDDLNQGTSDNCVIAGVRILLEAGPPGNTTVKKQLIVAKEVSGNLSLSNCRNLSSSDCWYVPVDTISYPGGINRGSVVYYGAVEDTNKDIEFTAVFSTLKYSDINDSQSMTLKKGDAVSNFTNDGQTVCFEGLRKGSFTFGKDGNLTVDVNMDDLRC